MNAVTEVEPPGLSAQQMINFLISEVRMSPMEISEALGGHVSRRTIYRWARGESVPQNDSNLRLLAVLHTKHHERYLRIQADES
jgi:DNA-binding transcriptional regulator YiaG